MGVQYYHRLNDSKSVSRISTLSVIADREMGGSDGRCEPGL